MGYYDKMKKQKLMLISMLCLISISALSAAGDRCCGSFPFFAFDNCMTVGDYTKPQVRADTLKELGYDGMGTRGTNLAEQTEIFEKAGLKLFSTYLTLDLDAEQKYDANLMKAVKQLKGKGTMLWFTVVSKKYKPATDEGDAVAVGALREFADAASESGLKIALYPHANCYVETLADSVRIAKKVNRRNVGGSFNVCHWLKVDGDIDYRSALKESLPYLFLVSINGAETGDTKKMGWDKLIQTLDKGTFDNYKLLKYLKDIGYTGPVGLQGYSIKGDPKQNLADSMKAWRRINEKSEAKLRKALIDGSEYGWTALAEDDFRNINCDPDTFTWKDGTIYCTGQPTGVISTKKSYTNFELVVEWRHMKHAGNSGIFVWASEQSLEKLQGGKGSLPDGIEVQILDPGYETNWEKEHGRKADWFTSHGDVFPVRAKLTPFPPVSANGSRSFPSRRLTKGIEEWNHYYVRCINGEVRLWVNGQEVSGGTDSQPRLGCLCLESEGSPVEFKNMRIRVLP